MPGTNTKFDVMWDNGRKPLDSRKWSAHLMKGPTNGSGLMMVYVVVYSLTPEYYRVGDYETLVPTSARSSILIQIRWAHGSASCMHYVVQDNQNAAFATAFSWKKQILRHVPFDSAGASMKCM